MAHWKGRLCKMIDRENFIQITQCIYDEARRLDPNMQINEENRKAIIQYGRKLGNDFMSIKREQFDNVEEFSTIMDCLVEYWKTMVSYYELCGEKIPAIEELVMDMDEAFCNPNTNLEKV